MGRPPRQSIDRTRDQARQNRSIGVLETRGRAAGWTSLQPQTFQTYREAMPMSTGQVTFLVTAARIGQERACRARDRGGRRPEPCDQALRGAEACLCTFVQISKDLFW